ncbi:MAG TPA: hypothetical protein DCR14_13940, partial [Acidimicrobiaceae bacterium]|nr:hypothetical protein [Acidimicrobiaceae bacterium]
EGGRGRTSSQGYGLVPLATSGFAAYDAPMTTPDTAAVDLGALYRAARERISALVTADGVDPDL